MAEDLPGELSRDFIETFEKVERQQQLRQALDKSFPAYEYVTTIHAYREHLATGIRLLGAAIESLKANFDQQTAARAYADVKFFYFALLSAHLSLEDHLFKRAKALRAAADFELMALAWKTSPQVQLVKFFRNRIQHGAMLPGTLRIEARTINHSDGAGLTAFFDPGKDTWSKVVDEANAKGKAYYYAEVAPQHDKLSFLIETYDHALRDLLAKIEAKFRDEYRAEFAEQEGLSHELNAVDAWLVTHKVAESRW